MRCTQVFSNLGKLLAAPAEEVELYGCVFQVSVEMGFGETAQADLVVGGGDIPVTAYNRCMGACGS